LYTGLHFRCQACSWPVCSCSSCCAVYSLYWRTGCCGWCS
jgi:hypothetical protein